MPSVIFFNLQADSQHQILFFESCRVSIRIVLDKFFRHFLNKSIESIKRISKRPFQVRLLLLLGSFSRFFLLGGGVPAASISVSSLDSTRVTSNVSSSLNVSALEGFEKELNRQANLREHLIRYLVELPVSSWNTIQIQSKSLVELTQSTNQLSRSLLVRQRKHFLLT